MQVVIADKFPERYLRDLRALGLDVDYAPDAPPERLAASAARAAILVVRSKKVSRAVIESARSISRDLGAGRGGSVLAALR